MCNRAGPSAQLDTPPQRYFDQRVWWSAVIESHLYDLATRARSPDSSRTMQGGLGPAPTLLSIAISCDDSGGSTKRWVQDHPPGEVRILDAFVRVLRSGRSIAYEPSAIVWHIHRASYDELRPHMYGYGVGLGAYMTKYLSQRATRRDVLKRLPRSAIHMLRLWGRPSDGGGGRPSLVIAEARGLVAGPLAYRRARRAH